MKKKFFSISKNSPIISFFVLAYLISWILWLPLLYGRFKLGWTSWEGDVWTNYKAWLGLLGALGPALAAIIMTYILEGGPGVKLLLKKVVQWRVKFIWWLVALYLWWLVATILAIILGVKPLTDILMQFVFALLNIPAIIFILQLPALIGMFGEELGWRGFALPKLLEKFNPITASLILAIPWMFWHTPLAVFDSWTRNAPLIEFILNYFIGIVPITIILTFFLKKVNGSVLLAMLLHRTWNLTFNAYSMALGLNEETFTLIYNSAKIIVWIIAAIITINYYFKKRQSPKTV